MINKNLKFCEIYLAFSQVDNLTERPTDRNYEGDVGTRTGNTNREGKDVKQERRDRTHTQDTKNIWKSEK